MSKVVKVTRYNRLSCDVATMTSAGAKAKENGHQSMHVITARLQSMRHRQYASMRHRLELIIVLLLTALYVSNYLLR